MTEKPEVLIHRALDNFNIELPSWGFANTGTRFGKFIQMAAAVSIEEKFSDAGQVHALTGSCPTVALHVQWDLPNGLKDVAQVSDWRRNTACNRARSTPMSFRTRNTSMDRWGIRILRFANGPSIIFWIV